MAAFTESEVEDAALEWLEGLGWEVAHGPDIAPHAEGTERTDYGEVILEQLHDALDRLNPALPAEALREGSVVSRHIHNAYREEELKREATCANFAQVRHEGGRKGAREIEHFNLDNLLAEPSE